MEPRLIEFPVHKDPTGNLAVADYDDLPFQVKRVFWIFDMRGSRGDHALRTCHQLIIPMSGIISVTIRFKIAGIIQSFRMTHQNVGLYLPPMVWRQITGTSGSSFFVLASHPFDEDDYIDGYNELLKELTNEIP